MTDPVASQPLGTLLGAIAAKIPAPGGGAATGVVGATAAALAGMVVSFSVGRKAFAEHAAFLEDAAARLARARAVFLMLADEDAAAFGELNRLMRLPEGDPEREAGWAAAVDAAMAPPRATLAAACDLLRICEALCGRSNRQLRSDLALAAIQAEATARGAAVNVAINLPLLPPERRSVLEAETGAMVAEARARTERVERACA